MDYFRYTFISRSESHFKQIPYNWFSSTRSPNKSSGRYAIAFPIMFLEKVEGNFLKRNSYRKVSFDSPWNNFDPTKSIRLLLIDLCKMFKRSLKSNNLHCCQIWRICEGVFWKDWNSVHVKVTLKIIKSFKL
jgi:hypothetical protein